MARPANQIINFRDRVDELLTAIERARAAAKTIDYPGSNGFYGAELDKVDQSGAAVYDVTKAQFGNAIDALAAIDALLEADLQKHGKALARMRD